MKNNRSFFSRLPIHRKVLQLAKHYGNMFFVSKKWHCRCAATVPLYLLTIVVIVTVFCVHRHFVSNASTSSPKNCTNKDTWQRMAKHCEQAFNWRAPIVDTKPKWSIGGPDNMSMVFEDISWRTSAGQPKPLAHYQTMALTEVEQQMPMAFVRVVYTDYWLLESELLINYAPNNWYCYVLDLKSNATFQYLMRELGAFFDNVIVLDQMFDIYPNGSNTNMAMMECVRALSDHQMHWKYLVTLQNHDVQAKTNAEMAQIFTWLGGANDVEVELQSSLTRDRLKHYGRNFMWTFDALHLFKDDVINHLTDQHGQPLALSVSKGYVAASLSRQFVDFVVNYLNVTTLLDQLNKGIFGVDEHFWQTLSTSEALKAPGGFPRRCFAGNGKKYKYITRFALWANDESSKSKCLSGEWRHGVCVFGLEDLMGPTSIIRGDGLPHLFVNKLMQDFDMDAVFCWHYWMRNKRRSGKMALDETFYRDWPQTRYQSEHVGGFGTEADDSTVDCDSGMSWKKREKEI